MPKAVFLDRATVDHDDLDLSVLEAVTGPWAWHDYSTPEEVRQRAAGAGTLVTNKVPLDRETLRACPDLRLVCVAATGTNNIDVAAAR
ncbi:MAG: glycerate dehydrogenase, partial [Pseudomonadota bacterium]